VLEGAERGALRDALRGALRMVADGDDLYLGAERYAGAEERGALRMVGAERGAEKLRPPTRPPLRAASAAPSLPKSSAAAANMVTKPFENFVASESWLSPPAFMLSAAAECCGDIGRAAAAAVARGANVE
jgi:hypothetical protein